MVSTGADGIKAENYVGKTISEVQAKLEANNINVIVDYKDVTEEDNIKDGIILSQKTEVGKQLVKGDSITLEVSRLIVVYPDFVGEAWYLDAVEEFCEEHGVVLETTYKEDGSKTEGTIIYQSRLKGSKVVEGVTLKVTVAKDPINQTLPEDPTTLEE